MRINSFRFGFFVGILAPIFSVFGLYVYEFNSISFFEFFEFLENIGMTMKVLTSCSMPSFLFFFLFHHFKFDRASQGVVGATLIVTLILVIVNSFG